MLRTTLYLEVAHLLHARRLRECLVVRLHAVDHDAPLAGRVDRAQRRDVGGGARAEVGLLRQLHQPVHAVVRVGQHVLGVKVAISR